MFVQKVRDDRKKEYIKIHREAWKELLFETKKAGFERQILWLFGNNILIYSMAENFDEAITRLKKPISIKNGRQKWRHYCLKLRISQIAGES